jgi:hypothetical protein
MAGHKRKPTYPLNVVKDLVAQEKRDLVGSAIAGGHTLGLSETEIWDVVSTLSPENFDKSETDFFNHRAWQDYYKVVVKGVNLFIKLKVSSREDDRKLIVTSFKADTDHS